MPTVHLERIGQEDHLRVEYLRRIDAPDLEYLVEFADSLDPDPSGWELTRGEVVTPIDDTWERVSVVDLVATEGRAARYGRVRLIHHPEPEP